MSAIDQINQGGITYEIVPEIAELFSSTKTYRAGDHVIYEAGWYTFKTDKYAGAWDATKVDGPFKVTNELSSLKSDFTDKADQTDLLKAFPTDTASGAVASFSDGANVPVKSLIVNIDPVQSGSGDPSPDNVRPISGWSEVNVEHAGKNLVSINISNVKKTNGYPSNYDLSFADDKITATVTGSGANWFTYKVLHVLPQLVGKTVFATWDSLPASTDKWLYLFDSTTSTGETIYADHKTITADMVGKDLCIFFKVYSVGTYVMSNIQVEFGSTPTPYEPYSGQSINIQLGQTVYGGKLDVVSGELVIDMAMVDMGDLIWTYNTSQAVFISGSIKTVVGRGTKIVCSTYKMTDNLQESALASLDKVIGCNKAPTQTTGNFQYGVIVVKDTAYTDESAFKTAVTGQTLVYELATPITVSLTPHEATALLGSNNVWADTGDSTVEYRADPTLYIGRLTEPDADMIADANITSGSYFMVGNTLYKATANIASGATISPNVNCTRKSLSEALNELNA